MTWLDALRTASFKGVPFRVQTATANDGRRKEIFEFPFSNASASDDYGKQARMVEITAYVLGLDYLTTRDALVRVLNEPGPGVLIHPSLGELYVEALPYTVSWSNDQGGIEYFTLSFKEVTRRKAGATQAPDPQGKLATRTDAAKGDAATAFAAQHNTSNAPDYLAQDAQAKAASVPTTLATATPKGGVLNQPAASAWQQQVKTYNLTLPGQMTQPTTLASSIQDIIGGWQAQFTNPSGALRGLRTLLSFGNSWLLAPLTTANRTRQRTNQLALRSLVQQTAFLEILTLTPDLTFASYNEAQAHVGFLGDTLTALLPEVGYDPLFESLQDAHAAAVATVNEDAGTLARNTTVPLAATLPSLPLAYRYYFDITDETDLIARNKVSHPLFVPPGDLRLLLLA